MCCQETVAKKTKTGKEQEGSFRLQRLMREEGGQQCKDGFCMYAEERLGNNINSAGIMWEMIEALFHGIRTVMSESGRARSGSFKLNWSSALQHFWEVILALTFVIKSFIV
jgi:hypothetical protein